MTMPRLSLGSPPGPHALEVARVGQELGCARVWLFDSAALYEDIWIWLDRIGRETDIGLGTAVLVPNLRHVMTTASAAATIEHSYPGRLVMGFGTGATARWVLGKRALSWATTRTYVENLRGLLAGEVVEVDGEPCQMIHWPGFTAERPMRIPILLSAMGPKGREITREIADGIIGVGTEEVDIGWHVDMFNGTVLADGEDRTTARVKEAVGPWAVLPYHGAHAAAPEFVELLPNGAEWFASIRAARPDGQHHLAVHEGHATHVTDRDRELVLDAAWDLPMAQGAWVGTPDVIRARAEAAGDRGVTELLYTPCGPDPVGEARRMAEVFASS